MQPPLQIKLYENKSTQKIKLWTSGQKMQNKGYGKERIVPTIVKYTQSAGKKVQFTGKLRSKFFILQKLKKSCGTGNVRMDWYMGGTTVSEA